MQQPNSLTSLFSAKSIAIIGVSSDVSKIGSVILNNLQLGGYTGKIFPVNPKYADIRGIPCYPSVSQIPEEVELVCISIPSPYVKVAVLDAIAKKVKCVVIISAGFGEVGTEGRKLETEIRELLLNANIRLLGPNCLGFMSEVDKVNLSFAAGNAIAGDIALFSQSGALCTAMLDRADSDGLGFSHLVSVGNKADINEVDLLDYFLDHQKVNVVGAYLESMVYGKKVLSAYTHSANKKPFVLIKPGVSEQAKQPIGAHTGSIAGSANAFETAMAQAGIMQVTSMDSFYSLLQCFSSMKRINGNRVAIVTNAGGPGIIATDEIVAQGLSLATLSPEIAAELKSLLPVEASVRNPIDLLGDAKADRFEKSLSLIVKDPQVDAVIVIMTPQFVTEIEKTAEIITAISVTSTIPLVPVMLGGTRMDQGIRVLNNGHIVSFNEISEAVERIKQLSMYYANRSTTTYTLPVVSDTYEKLPDGNGNALPTAAAQSLLEAFDIPTAPQTLASQLPEALSWAQNHYPVVLKIPNEVLIHKTEKRGVVVNIKNAEELTIAWNELVETEKDLLTIGSAPSLLLQKMIKFEEELFVGANRDGNSDVYSEDAPGFGHLLVFGKGGIYTELYKDYGYAMVPATNEQLLIALSKTQISHIMTGLRNKEPLAVSAFITMLANVQRMLIAHPEIISVDFNPVLITQTAVYTVDTKIFVKY